MIISLLSFFLQPVNGAYSSYLQLILRNSGYTQSMVGVIIAVGSIASIILPFFAGAVVEKTGNDKLLMFLGAVTGVMTIVPAILGAPVWLTLITFFICLGMNWMTLSLADGYINKCINNDNAKYGLIRGLGTLGYVVFMVMFSLTGFPDETNNYQILQNIILCTSLFLIFLLLSPDTRKLNSKKTEEKRKFFDSSWYDKTFWIFVVTVAFSRIPMATFDKLLPSYMTEVLSLGKWFTAFTALGAFAEFFMLVFGGKDAAKRGTNPINLLILSCVGILLRLLLYISSDSIVVFALAQTMHALCFGACHLAVNSYITHNVAPEHVSGAFAIYWTLGTNLPQLLGTLLGGFVIDYLGYPVLFAINMGFPLITLCLIFAFRSLYYKK